MSQQARRIAVPAALAVLLILAACSHGGFRIVRLSDRCRPRSGEAPAKAIVRCGETSVAYVETQDASGTGVVVGHGRELFVVTNTHVVDPWDSADVTVGGREYFGIDVVGVDAAADIAVLGPLPDDADAAALQLASAVEPERGDDVFLIGFPGEPLSDDPDDHVPTISGGIASRTRHVKAFDQTYFQTDASIAGGQSGGPLFDAQGRLIGISGLSFAEEFALVLSAEDVVDATRMIFAGDGDRYPDLPVVAGTDETQTGTIEIADASDEQMLYLPASESDRELEFVVDVSDGLVVSMWSTTSTGPIAMSANYDAVEEQLAALIDAAAAAEAASGDTEGETPIDEYDEYEDDYFGEYEEEYEAAKVEAVATEVSPGRFRVDVPADEAVSIEIAAPLTERAVVAKFNSSLSVRQASAGRSEEPLDVGTAATHVLTTFDDGADFLVELDAGQQVQVVAESAQSDVGLMIFPPSVKMGPVVLDDPWMVDGVTDVDDSGGGLYGVDAVTVVEAEESGTYRIRLYSAMGGTLMARIAVTDCRNVRCEDAG